MFSLKRIFRLGIAVFLNIHKLYVLTNTASAPTLTECVLGVSAALCMLHCNALLDSLNAMVHSLRLKNKEGLYPTTLIEAML